MTKLKDNVIDKIREDDISPRPKYLFGLRNATMWVIASLATLVGILSVSLITYNLTSQDWDIYSHLNESFLGFLVSTLPYLWIVLMIIMLAIAILNVEHSKKGYKYPPILVVIISLAATLVIGLSVQAFGGGKTLDDFLGKELSSYQTVESQREAVWNQPSKGLFSGTIKSVDNKVITIEDSAGKLWQVDYSDATIRGNLELSAGTRVKIIGQFSDNIITASEIRPWMGNGKGKGHGSRQE